MNTVQVIPLLVLLAAPCLGADDFVALPGGVVIVDGRAWPSMSAWHDSDEFRSRRHVCGRVVEGEDRGAQRGIACGQQENDASNPYLPESDYYEIPIYFHCITLENETNVEDCTGYVPLALMQAQIDSLNDDFRAIMGGAGENGTDTFIQFSFDTNDVTWTRNAAWFADANDAYRTALSVDPEHYINIYTNSADGNLGWAYMPYGGVVGTPEDGITIVHTAIGPNGGVGNFDYGRTLTHEMGHYLGLYHTFGGFAGDSETTCPTGSCGGSGDLICDTNPEEVPHYGCTASATCSSPDAIENYMNYTRDLCMTEFTTEQSTRMRCTLEFYRPTLIEDAALGACCIGGVCTQTTNALCANSGGDWHGAGADCTGELCTTAPPEGDTCEDAVTVALGDNAFDTTGLTLSNFGEVDVSQCEDEYGEMEGADIWFTLNIEASGTLSATTCDPASFDTSLVVYRGATCDGLVQEACSGDHVDEDPACQDYYSEVSLTVEADEQLTIRVGGWEDGDEGAGVLNIGLVVNVCAGEVTGDGVVDVDDVTAIVYAFGDHDEPYDINNDGDVGVVDLLLVLEAFGGC